MVLSDFLSRQTNDNSNPHKIVPISFNMHRVLQESFYKIDSYLVQKDLRLDLVVLNFQRFVA